MPVTPRQFSSESLHSTGRYNVLLPTENSEEPNAATFACAPVVLNGAWQSHRESIEGGDNSVRSDYFSSG